MKTRFLSKREIKEVLRELKINVNYKKLHGLKETVIDNFVIYHIDKIPLLFRKNSKIYPTIYFIYKFKLELPYVIVDKGAVKHVLNGADIMRPGIKEFSNFKKGEIVMIISEDQKLLAIGEALYESEEIKNMTKGKVIRNIHYFGDKICKLSEILP